MFEETYSERLSVVHVDDDAVLAEATAQYLRSYAVDVHVVTRPDSAVVEILRARPDVVLCEATLKVASGHEVWRVLREHLDVPIIVVSAADEEADEVMSLEGGADDYVTKPLSQRQLLARIRAQARRARGNVGPAKTQIRIGELSVDCATMTVALRGQQVPVTTYEFALTRVLAERAGRVLTREQLLELVQGSTEEAFDRSVDVHISRLRHKLGDDPRSPRLLKTVRGVGYMLMPQCA
jgi:DNA-binding response OmpR family regulator